MPTENSTPEYEELVDLSSIDDTGKSSDHIDLTSLIPAAVPRRQALFSRALKYMNHLSERKR